MSILTTAIGLILTFLILSLLASGIQETLSSWFTLRGKFLGRTLDHMLTNRNLEDAARQVDKSLLEKFLAHNHFQNLLQGESQQKPSYMKAKTFASILIHLLDGTDVKSLQTTVGNMNDGSLKTFLQNSLTEAGNDLEKFRQKLEDWYDEVMERTSGSYKRFCHNSLIGIGLLLGVYFNADALAMYEKMARSNNSAQQAEQVIDLAQSMLGNSRVSDYMAQGKALQATQQQAQSNRDSLKTLGLDSILLAQNQALLVQTKNYAAELKADESPLGLGWTSEDIAQIKHGNIGFLTLKLLGFFITAIAVSMGAPFWFDLLNRFMNIRNSGHVAAS